VVYGRQVGERQLSFEASGALLDASLVMRDRETDSWWSIMSSSAIGGELEGTGLETLPQSEKTTWKSWVSRHPDTLVLSVEGEEHVDNNPYDNYLGSEGTFRDLEVDDDRLAAKEPIYTFWHDGSPWAAPHVAFAGGRLFSASALGDRAVLLYRTPDAPIYESTRGWLVGPEPAIRELAIPELLAQAEAGTSQSIEPLPGFDTFWYTWVAVNDETGILD
jgi:hypothetical protein